MSFSGHRLSPGQFLSPAATSYQLFILFYLVPIPFSFPVIHLPLPLSIILYSSIFHIHSLYHYSILNSVLVTGGIPVASRPAPVSLIRVVPFPLFLACPSLHYPILSLSFLFLTFLS